MSKFQLNPYFPMVFLWFSYGFTWMVSSWGDPRFRNELRLNLRPFHVKPIVSRKLSGVNGTQAPSFYHRVSIGNGVQLVDFPRLI